MTAMAQESGEVTFYSADGTTVLTKGFSNMVEQDDRPRVFTMPREPKYCCVRLNDIIETADGTRYRITALSRDKHLFICDGMKMLGK